MNSIQVDNEWMIYTVGEALPLKRLCLKAIVYHTPIEPLHIQYAKINKLNIPTCLKNDLYSSLYSEFWLNSPKIYR